MIIQNVLFVSIPVKIVLILITTVHYVQLEPIEVPLFQLVLVIMDISMQEHRLIVPNALTNVQLVLIVLLIVLSVQQDQIYNSPLIAVVLQVSMKMQACNVLNVLLDALNVLMQIPAQFVLLELEEIYQLRLIVAAKMVTLIIIQILIIAQLVIIVFVEHVLLKQQIVPYLVMKLVQCVILQVTVHLVLLVNSLIPMVNVFHAIIPNVLLAIKLVLPVQFLAMLVVKLVTPQLSVHHVLLVTILKQMDHVQLVIITALNVKLHQITAHSVVTSLEVTLLPVNVLMDITIEFQPVSV